MKVALFKHGYVKPDLTEVEPRLIQYCTSFKMALRTAKAFASISGSLHNYYAVKMEKTIRGWQQIESTTRYF